MRNLTIFLALALIATPVQARPNPSIGCNAYGYHLVWVNGWPRWVPC